MLKLKHTADMVGGAISSSMNWWTAFFRFVQNPLSATSLSQDKRGASCISISGQSVSLKMPREEMTIHGPDDAMQSTAPNLPFGFLPRARQA